jgi:hypothetical protein
MVEGLGIEVLPQPYQPADRGYAIVERVQDAEFKCIHIQTGGQHVEKAFLRHRRLRHAKAAKRAGWHAIGVHRPRGGAVIGDPVGTGRMDRHPVGHGRPP